MSDSRVTEPLVLAEMEHQREHGLDRPIPRMCACTGGPRCCLIRSEAARRLRTETGDTRPTSEVEAGLRARYDR